MAKPLAPPAENKFCHTCAFWLRFDREDGGCFRYAPRPQFSYPVDKKAEHPHTKQFDFCGDWEQKKV